MSDCLHRTLNLARAAAAAAAAVDDDDDVDAQHVSFVY